MKNHSAAITLKLTCFHTKSATDYGFVGMSITVCDESKFLPPYTSTLLLDRVSPKNLESIESGSDTVAWTAMCDSRGHIVGKLMD